MAAKAKSIKLGLDVHADLLVVVRIIDGAAPQPAQRFAPREFLAWCAKQLTLAEKVYTCYEAGPFGYTLHRALEKMGVVNCVVRPRDWDEYGKKVKTDIKVKGSVPHNHILLFLLFFPASRSRFAKEPAAPMFNRWAIQCKVIVVSWRNRRASLSFWASPLRR